MTESSIVVIIPTFNEEPNLPACLESVAFADEVFVVDSQSTDGTCRFFPLYRSLFVVARKSGPPGPPPEIRG